MIDAKTRRDIWERDGGICGLCGQPVPFDRHMHIDHIKPLAWGGPNTEDNLQAAHGRCNCAKGRRLKGQTTRVLSVIKGVAVRFILRLPPEVHEELKRWADEEKRSLHGQIMWLIDRALRDRRRD